MLSGFFFFFSNHEEQLRAVSLEPTFLTDGGALVPYEISESTAACEDENVPCKVSHSFIKKKKNPSLGNYLLTPLKKIKWLT